MTYEFRENRGKVQSSGVLKKFHPHLLHNKLLLSHHSVFSTNVYSKTLYKTIFARNRILVVYMKIQLKVILDY